MAGNFRKDGVKGTSRRLGQYGVRAFCIFTLDREFQLCYAGAHDRFGSSHRLDRSELRSVCACRISARASVAVYEGVLEMKTGEKTSVTIKQGEYAGRTLLLDVEEFQPIEPSAYAWTAGWNCAVEIAGESVWFFIGEDGTVWDDANDEVGICPEQECEFARMLDDERKAGA